MPRRLKLLIIYLVLLAITLFLLFVTFQYIIDVYSKEKTQAQTTIMLLQNQLADLEKLSNKPENQLKPELFKVYDQKYNTNLEMKLEYPSMSASSHFVPQDTGARLQALKAYKKQQIENIRERSFFSQIPEWPTLILGVIGIIATRIINSITDLCIDVLKNRFIKRTRQKRG